jgi:hypothetical protein
MSAIPVGSTITSFVLSLPVDSSGVNANAAGASIVACTPKAAWSSGKGAAAYQGKPADACDTHSPKLTAADGGKAYTADIAAIAQQWVERNALNLGVAIRDNPSNTSTVYQVVFGPSAALAQLTAHVTYRAPSAAGSIAGGAGGRATAPSPAVAPPPRSAVAPPAPQPPPSSSGQPAQVANPPAPVVAPAHQAAAAAQPPDGSAPPVGFWVALALVLLLLVATAVVLADPRVAVVRSPDRGVAKALRTRLILTPREASRS